MSDPQRAPGGASHDEPPAAGPGPGRVDAFVRRLRLILEDHQVAARVSSAGISVRIDLSDVPGRSVTLRFDRQPPAIDDGAPAAHPTVRLILGSGELDALLREGSHLPMAILAGDVTFEGSVRKLLRVMPILRGGALGLPDEEQDAL